MAEQYYQQPPHQQAFQQQIPAHAQDDDEDDNDGWGVDSDVYTTKLNTGQLTQAQIDMAIQLEQEILSESQAGRAGYEYEYTEEEPQYNQQPQYQNQGGASAGHGRPAQQPAKLPNSAEEALQMLAQRKQHHAPQQQQQQQQRSAQRPARAQQQRPARVQQRQFGTAEDEIRAYHALCKQYRMVQLKLAQIGEPTPLQKKSFLQNLTKGLIRCLRYPVPAVRNKVGSMFLAIGWNVRLNRSTAPKPPTGAQMKELLAKTVDFFGARHNLPTRSKYTLPARQNVARPRQPQQRNNRPQHNGQRSYNNNNNNNSRQNNYHNSRPARGQNSYSRNQGARTNNRNQRQNRPVVRRNNNQGRQQYGASTQ